MTTPKFPYWRTKFNPDNPEVEAQIRTQYEVAKAYRSEVIDASTLVELELDWVLCDALVGIQPDLRNQFKSLILAGEFCSFFQKWRLLRALINTNSMWWQACKPECHNDQVKKLKSLISHRNAFSHGEIVINSKTLVPTLKYFEGEEMCSILTDTYVQNILDEAEAMFPWLGEMQINFGKINNVL